jgi:hypothetical protein
MLQLDSQVEFLVLSCLLVFILSIYFADALWEYYSPPNFQYHTRSSQSFLQKVSIEFNETYRFDSNIKLHQNLVGSDQKNIRFVADQSTLTFGPDHREGCPEIDLTFLTASRTLNH